MDDDRSAAKRDLSALRISRDGDRPRGGRWGVAFVLLVLVALAAAFGYRRYEIAARPPAVETALVRRVGASDAGALLSASGYVLPDRRANVSSKGFGRIEWIGVDVGSVVRKDEVIARLANADVAAQVEEAKAAVAEAERELARVKGIVEQGFETREKLDRAGTTLDLARARLRGAEAAFEYTLIRAPFDGVVVRKGVEVGETVGPTGGTGAGSTGPALCTIIDRASLEMVADVNETNIAKIHLGQEVEVVADARPDRKYRGQVRQIVPTADRQKGIVQVKVRLDGIDAALLPEMAARATFLRAGTAVSDARRVLAPRAAVRERGGRRFVFVLEAGRVRAVPVETGLEGEDGVEILAGLAGGELVVVGGEPVEDGAEVRTLAKEKN